MLIRLNLRMGLILLAALAILMAGVAYAATVISQRQVSGSLILGQVQAIGPILLYSQITPSSADLTELAFDTGDIDSSGSFVTPPREPFWAANRGSVPFNLILVATDVVIKRGGNTILSGDGILSLLMGPAGGTLRSSADHATLINTGGQPVALEAGLTFLRTPQDLGLIQGDVITFTALFKALEVPTAVPGDVNGDGVPDFIVGAYQDDPVGGGTDAGSAYVFSGADGSLLYQVTGETTGDNLGWSVSMAGDVNGDGRADFIVGAYADDPAGRTNAGSAYVFSGADGSLLYQKTGDTAFDQFGYSVSGAGDVNGDGRADFIVGARFDDPPGGTNAGSAYVFSGADGSLLYQASGDTSSDQFGYSVSGAGDVNGDGRADFIVGARFDDPPGGTNAGSAYVFSGADGSLLYQVTGDTTGDEFGRSVSGAGDVNGDGKADFIVGAILDDPGGLNNAGSAYVFSGADGSLLYQVSGTTLDFFGWSVSGAGDMNGDGKADFIVGAILDDLGGGTNAGSAYVFSGADGSLLYQRTGDTAFDHFGSSVSGVGDVNGDGKADFIVGANDDDPAGGGTDAGSAYVFSGADGSLLYQRTGDTASDFFGVSVGGGGL